MLRIKLFILIIISFALKSSSQIQTINPFFFGESGLETDIITTNLTSIGTYYADPKWNAGNIYLNNGDSLVAYYMRYDLVRNHLELILDTKILAINGSFIDRFEWFSVERLRPEKFISKSHYSFDETDNVPGFPQVLAKGDISLLKCQVVFAPTKATSPTLVNSTDDKIHVIEKLYFAKSTEVFEVSRGKKKNLHFINESEVDDYVNESNLKFHSESDLKKIIEFANEIK